MKQATIYALLILAGFLAGKAVPTKNPNYSHYETSVRRDTNANNILYIRDPSRAGDWQPVYNLGK